MKDLRQGIIQNGSDSLLSDLSEQLALAQEALETAQSRRNSQEPEIQTRLAQWEDLNRKMDERAEGVLLGLSIKAASEKQVLEQLQSEATRIREGAQRAGKAP